MAKEKKQRNKKKKGSGIIGEFRTFIMRGNVMDMAVGVIIGGAFTAIVTSLNKDILSPLLALLIGSTDFSYLQVILGEGEEAPILLYGNFITAILNFLITAVVIFVLIKIINGLSKLFTRKKEKEEAAAPTTKECPYCKSTIALTATRCPHCTSHLEE